MTYRLKTAPTVEPVSLAEFVQHARIDAVPSGDDATAEETDIALKLKAARRHIEQQHGRAVITSTWYAYLEHWPCGSYIELPLGNLQSVTAITYTDSAGVTHTWASTNYKLTRTYTVPESGANEADAGFGRIVLAYNAIWPTETLDTGEPIRIEFVCGWKDAASVPADVKISVEIGAKSLYENRDSISEDAEKAIASYMAPYTDYKF